MSQFLRAPSCRAILVFLLAAGGAVSQTPPTQTPPATTPAPATPTQPPIDKNAPEMSTQEAPALFKARVNLVLVPVIVRDPKGATVGSFTKDNFQLFDRGKLQDITRFSVEKSGGKVIKEAQTVDTIPGEGAESAAPLDVPERFVAYLFDDIHIQFGDLVRARDAAGRQIASMAKTDRAAIYTTSGQNQLDFTDDQDKLHQTLLSLRTRSISNGFSGMQCPDISYYMADLIVNKNDSQSISVGVQEVIACNGGTMTPAQALPLVQSAAMRELNLGDQETRVTMSVLLDVVRRMSSMPGQRIVILASPGFLNPMEKPQETEILDKAIRANVLINSIDARGLWVDPMVDASNPGRAATTGFLLLKQQEDRMAASAQADILAEMAAGTGGSFYQNNNDLDAGFRQLATAPEFYYVLGFSPQNLKLDGAYHSLKVSLKTTPGVSMALQSRKGYYAPKKLSTADETAKEEIEDAVFSREELTELPVELHTQFFKSSDKEASITVLCRMDPRHIQFRKADGRNSNIVTVVSAVFDRNGNFVSGNQKTVDLKLKDETLAKLAAAGTMSLKTTFSVPPATYMVRLVVRDSEGQLMSALSSAVAIQ